MSIPNLSFWVACDNYGEQLLSYKSACSVPEGFAYLLLVFVMQGRFLKSYNLTVKLMGGKKVYKKKKSRGREKHEIQTGTGRDCNITKYQIMVLLN